MPVLYSKFKTNRSHYVYDTSSSQIFEVSPAVWNAIDDYLQPPGPNASCPDGDTDTRAAARREIAEAIDAGYFTSCEIGRMRFYDSPERLAERVRSRVSQLTLEVTEACNSQCSYCPYSHDSTRRAASARMEPATACRAVDVFMAHSGEAPARAISFWGGEPLLNETLIRHVVHYAKRQYPAREVRFSFTTNATLITSESARFLADHDFQLLVSLDGPRPIHDRHRRDPTGLGTFERAMRGLAVLQSMCPDYYAERVSFNAVLTPGFTLTDVASFFAGHALCRGHRVTVGPASLPSHFVETRGAFSDAERLGYRRALCDALASCVGPPTEALATAASTRLFQIAGRHRGPVADAVAPNGCCVPLLKKMHVTADGAIHICEKVQPDSPVGHVLRGGVDMRRVEGLVNEYTTHSLPDCRACWAVRLCTACYRYFIEAHNWADADRAGICERLRQIRLDALVDYVTVLEANPRAFEYLKDVRPILPV